VDETVNYEITGSWIDTLSSNVAYPSYALAQARMRTTLSRRIIVSNTESFISFRHFSISLAVLGGIVMHLGGYKVYVRLRYPVYFVTPSSLRPQTVSPAISATPS